MIDLWCIHWRLSQFLLPIAVSLQAGLASTQRIVIIPINLKLLLMNTFTNKIVVITGGTDGIGAAAALELCRLGATVVIIGRSEQKTDALLEKALDLEGEGYIEPFLGDFSTMRTVEKIAKQVAAHLDSIDILIHAVGILISRTAHSKEGIELDFAVSYLSRFVFTEVLHQQGCFHTDTCMINIAASNPEVPRLFQMEFDDLATVKIRTGMKGHGQAQLANDLYTALAARRYQITTIGYGPGTVDTSIRREVPRWLQFLMRPFFKSRAASDVAVQFAHILADPLLLPSKAYFYNKDGPFPTADFIDNVNRQQALFEASLQLITEALVATIEST